MREGTYQRNLLVKSKENQDLLQKVDKCDRYDYLIAVACGVIGGAVDIFFVGTPGNSLLENWTDSQVDNVIRKFAQMTGWNPKEGKKENVASAIYFLEKKFKVNYDQRYSRDVGGLFDMSTKNHHIMSLSHSPDIIGLFFSILNQFTSTSTFIAKGKVVTIKTDTFELQGGNIIAKLYCGAANWFGHIMSDMAGSSGGRGNSGRGSGVAVPFYELFQFCKFGKFNVGKNRQDLATIAVRAFQEGYDFRFGLATSIPVLITELFIRLIWSIRRYFQYEKLIGECIPDRKHDDLRIMLLFGNGTLCLLDGMDAGICSGGNFLKFFKKLNLIAWYRFVSLVLKEVCIRIGITDALQKDIEAYKRINEALLFYLHELELVDAELFNKETEVYNVMVMRMENAYSERELNGILLDAFQEMGINKPWKGDFNDYMENSNERLVFK